MPTRLFRYVLPFGNDRFSTPRSLRRSVSDMNKLKKYTVFFLIGGAGYAVIELLWRGHTHWTMVIAGGICFVIFSLISKNFPKKSLIYKSILCAVSVTGVEFVFGIIFNVILKMNIWDYSKVPLNLCGQVCPLFTVLWGVLGLIFIPLADVLNKKLAP